jgi:hypothetical protein
MTGSTRACARGIAFKASPRLTEKNPDLRLCGAEILKQRDRWTRQLTLSERLAADAVEAAFIEFQQELSRDERQARRRPLNACLDRIPPRGRSILQCRFVDQLGYARICYPQLCRSVEKEKSMHAKGMDVSAKFADVRELVEQAKALGSLFKTAARCRQRLPTLAPSM